MIEDAAHAFPASIENKMIGNLGDITCFSFYANKTITTGEGGLLTTNDEAIAEKVKKMRLHGIDRNIWDRYTSKKTNWEYDVVEAGYKYNMPDINAAVGLAQLERANEMQQKRKKIAESYYEKLKDINAIYLPVTNVNFDNHAWHLFPIKISDESNISRDDLILNLSKNSIGTSVHYKPIHQLTYYKNRYKLDSNDYPNSEKLWRSILSLPIYSLLTENEVDIVVGKIRLILQDN